MRFKTTYLIGVGGTGSHLVGPLVQLMEFHPNGSTDIVLVDGDHYDDSNRTRQVFDRGQLGENKAVATAARLGHPDLRAVASFIDEEKFSKLLDAHTPNKNDNVLIIMAVDNHATRKAIVDALDKTDRRNFVCLSPGNSYATGQVIAYIKRKGKPLTLHPYEKYQDWQNPPDHIPRSVDGCDRQVNSTPQLLVVNMAAAWGVLLQVFNLLDDKGYFDELHFDCFKAKFVPQGALRKIEG